MHAMHAMDSVCFSRNKGTDKVKPCLAPARLFYFQTLSIGRYARKRTKPPDPLLPLVGTLGRLVARIDRSVVERRSMEFLWVGFRLPR